MGITGLLIGALFSWLSVYCIRTYAVKKLLDVPNQRSLHRIPTPRGGGLAIVIVFSVVGLILLLQGRLGATHVSALASSLVIAAIGFWDDHRHIPAGQRFAVHVLAAACALYFIQGFPPVTLARSFWYGC